MEPTSIGPPWLLQLRDITPSFHMPTRKPKDRAGAASCPRVKSTVKSISPSILRQPTQTLYKNHIFQLTIYTILFLLTLSKNSVWLPSHCDSLFRIEDSPPPFHLCSKGPLQTLSKPPQPPQAQVIRHWNKWWYFYGIFECNRPFSPIS